METVLEALAMWPVDREGGRHRTSPGHRGVTADDRDPADPGLCRDHPLENRLESLESI